VFALLYGWTPGLSPGMVNCCASSHGISS
jgi:hypothetical protein